MTKIKILPTAFHKIPEDVKKVLELDDNLLDRWNALTPLARNEWVCWITIVKKNETRKEHIVRMKEELYKGKKRPCCWPGCSHRNKKQTML